MTSITSNENEDEFPILADNVSDSSVRSKFNFRPLGELVPISSMILALKVHENDDSLRESSNSCVLEFKLNSLASGYKGGFEKVTEIMLNSSNIDSIIWVRQQIPNRLLSLWGQPRGAYGRFSDWFDKRIDSEADELLRQRGSNVETADSLHAQRVIRGVDFGKFRALFEDNISNYVMSRLHAMLCVYNDSDTMEIKLEISKGYYDKEGQQEVFGNGRTLDKWVIRVNCTEEEGCDMLKHIHAFDELLDLEKWAEMTLRELWYPRISYTMGVYSRRSASVQSRFAMYPSCGFVSEFKHYDQTGMVSEARTPSGSIVNERVESYEDIYIHQTSCRKAGALKVFWPLDSKYSRIPSDKKINQLIIHKLSEPSILTNDIHSVAINKLPKSYNSFKTFTGIMHDVAHILVDFINSIMSSTRFSVCYSHIPIVYGLHKRHFDEIVDDDDRAVFTEMVIMLVKLIAFPSRDDLLSAPLKFRDLPSPCPKSTGWICVLAYLVINKRTGMTRWFQEVPFTSDGYVMWDVHPCLTKYLSYTLYTASVPFMNGRNVYSDSITIASSPYYNKMKQIMTEKGLNVRSLDPMCFGALMVPRSLKVGSITGIFIYNYNERTLDDLIGVVIEGTDVCYYKFIDEIMIASFMSVDGWDIPKDTELQYTYVTERNMTFLVLRARCYTLQNSVVDARTWDLALKFGVTFGHSTLEMDYRNLQGYYWLPLKYYNDTVARLSECSHVHHPLSQD